MLELLRLGMRQVEIARVLGVRSDTVKQHVRRLRTKLQSGDVKKSNPSRKRSALLLWFHGGRNLT
ncbi:hypothetical protein IV102_33780 [bacterium]|nr:hypothetical protein [bacterium]